MSTFRQVTADEALALVRGYASANRVTFSGHARQRAALRAGGGSAVAHVLHALKNAAECRPATEADRWRATGPDLDGDELTAIVVIEDGLIIVTVF